MRGYFITGTDTEVGKTVATVALMRALIKKGERVIGMKPIASGSDETDGGLRNSDALAIQAACSEGVDYEQVNPYTFEPPVAPHIAAEQAGVVIDFGRIADTARQLAEESDLIVVEGVGGWQVPLGKRLMLPDLACKLGLPVILVVGMRLGCINHALLTAAAIERSGLELAGWIANFIDPGMDRPDEVLLTLKRHINAPLVMTIPYLDSQQLDDNAAFPLESYFQ